MIMLALSLAANLVSWVVALYARRRLYEAQVARAAAAEQLEEAQMLLRSAKAWHEARGHAPEN